MSRRLYGVTTLKINGREWQVKKGTSFDPGGFKNNPEMHSGGLAGYSREPVPSSIEATILFGQGDRGSDLQFTNATVTLETDSGQAWVINGAFTTETPKITETEAKITINGPTAEEIA